MRLVDVYPYRMNGGTAEFLLLLRAGNRVYADQWRMVGGKIEEPETAWQAGLRELKEETGQSPELYWVLPSLNHFYSHREDRIELIPAFAARLEKDAAITLDGEHSEYKWIRSDEVDSLVHWPEQRRLLRLLATIITEKEILEDWKIPC